MEEACCVVTGGRGSASCHLVEMLIRSNEWRIRIADLGPTINLDTAEESGVVCEVLRSGHAAYLSTDLMNKFRVVRAIEAAGVVFHMAASDSSINGQLLAHSLESWNGGILVMVSGLVQNKDCITMRKFAETFFLLLGRKDI